MLAEELRKQIRSKLDEKNLDVRGLEKKAGLPQNAVRNILYGASNNPGIVTLEAITNVLGCSVDELLGREHKKDSSENKTSFLTHMLYETLLSEVFNYVLNYIQKMNYTLSLEKFIFLLRESYLYCLEKNDSTLNKNFIDWLIDKNID